MVSKSEDIFPLMGLLGQKDTWHPLMFSHCIDTVLIFVVLDISLDLVKERLAGRGQGEEALAKEHYKYEPATDDEPNTVGFKIIKSRSKQENAEAVLDLINKKHQSNIA